MKRADRLLWNWRRDALEDGWKIASNSGLPFPEMQIYLEKQVDKERKWVCAIDIRATVTKGTARALVLWGPDGLQLIPPKIYSMASLKRRLRICQYCGKEGDIMRLGFAGRACADCRKNLVAKIEYPGWAD